MSGVPSPEDRKLTSPRSSLARPSSPSRLSLSPGKPKIVSFSLPSAEGSSVPLFNDSCPTSTTPTTASYSFSPSSSGLTSSLSNSHVIHPPPVSRLASFLARPTLPSSASSFSSFSCSPTKVPRCSLETLSPVPLHKQNIFDTTSSRKSSPVSPPKHLHNDQENFPPTSLAFNPFSPYLSPPKPTCTSPPTKTMKKSPSSSSKSKPNRGRKKHVTTTDVLAKFAGKRTRSGRQVNNMFASKQVDPIKHTQASLLTPESLRAEASSWAERVNNCLDNLKVIAELGLLDYMCHILPAFDDLQCSLTCLNKRILEIKFIPTGSANEMNVKYIALLKGLAESMGNLSLEEAGVLVAEELSNNKQQSVKIEGNQREKDEEQKKKIDAAEKRKREEAKRKEEEEEEAAAKEETRRQQAAREKEIKLKQEEEEETQPLGNLKKKNSQKNKSVEKKPVVVPSSTPKSHIKQTSETTTPIPPCKTALPPVTPKVSIAAAAAAKPSDGSHAEWLRQQELEKKKKERKERERRQVEEMRRAREQQDRDKMAEFSRECAAELEQQRQKRLKIEGEAEEKARKKAGVPPPHPSPPPEPSSSKPHRYDEGTEGDDDTRWQAFVFKFGDHKGGTVQFSDVPWPRDEFRPPTRELITVQKYFKKLLLRWHPDKFNVYGTSMDPGIMAKVTSIAQTIIPRWNVFSSR